MESLERFFSRCSFDDSSKTQIPFGNDKQRKIYTDSPSGMTNKGNLHLRGDSYRGSASLLPKQIPPEWKVQSGCVLCT
jgi:hypothetical protein